MVDPEQVPAKATPAEPTFAWSRVAALLAGAAGFLLFAMTPGVPDAVDPSGEVVALSREGRLALEPQRKTLKPVNRKTSLEFGSTW